MTGPAERELRELARRTDGIRPAAGFTDAIMAAVEAEETAPASGARLSDGLMRSGIWAVALSAAAAVACVFVSLEEQSRFDEDVIVAVDVAEVGE